MTDEKRTGIRTAELFIVPIDDETPAGILFSVISDPTRGVFLTDHEARALRDWLVATYGPVGVSA